MPRNPQHTIGICPTCGNTVPPGNYNNVRASYCDGVCQRAWHQGVRFVAWDDGMDQAIKNVVDHSAVPEQSVIEHEMVERLREALGELQPRARFVVTRRFSDGCTRSEIADEINASPSRVAQIERYAIKRLQLSFAGLNRASPS